MVSFLNHIASILYERGLTCGAVYPLYCYMFRRQIILYLLTATKPYYHLLMILNLFFWMQFTLGMHQHDSHDIDYPGVHLIQNVDYRSNQKLKIACFFVWPSTLICKSKRLQIKKLTSSFFSIIKIRIFAFSRNGFF